MSKPIVTGGAADYASIITALYVIIKSNTEDNIIYNNYYKIYNNYKDESDNIDTKISNDITEISSFKDFDRGDDIPPDM